ncbi:unnamed protein product, partial [Hapterophycus canaliculatus]
HRRHQFLAFKSDVDFWRRNKSLRGLSVRTLFMEVFFQTIILLSLVEEDASLLVTVPAGVGVLIQAFVYTFGFVLMTPQLYINYKLKSVAHLPWRFLCYRSLNTVIDDLFAFVIRMPTMHRLSCFRDDVVFVVYLYQRWMYPVDANRPQDRGA